MKACALVAAAILAVTVVWYDPASAQFDRDIASTKSTAEVPGMNDMFQSISSGRGLSEKDIIFHNVLAENSNLFAVSGTALAWPGFPRSWFEASKSTMVDATASFGISLMASGGIKIKYRWEAKSSLVIISSVNEDAGELDKNLVTKNPTPEPVNGNFLDSLQLQMFKWDPRYSRALPNVRKGHPMVAFCAFEVSLNYTDSKELGFNFIGSGTTVQFGSVYSLSMSMYSKLFQIDGTQSGWQLLDGLCESRFRPYVEKAVYSDFSMNALEFISHKDPANACQPNPNDGADGDLECLAWANQWVDPNVRYFATPRCVQGRNGLHSCQMLAKSGRNCPMYWSDKAGKPVPPQMLSSPSYSKVTNAPFEFNCDARAGLVCEMQSPPTMLLGAAIFSGSAKCVHHGPK